MKSKKYAEVDKNICVSCGACTKVCPMSATSVGRGCYSVGDKEKCVGCGSCVRTCPAGCIALFERGQDL